MRYAQQRWDHLATLIAVSDDPQLVVGAVAELERATGHQLPLAGRARPGDVVALRRFARVHRYVLAHSCSDEFHVRRAVEAAIARVSGRPAEPSPDRALVAVPA